MHEEVNDRTIALAVRGTKMTADLLRSSIMAVLRERHYRKRYSGRHSGNKEVAVHGKQSLRKLMQNGSELTDIEISEDNIKSFERIARKYHIDFSLKKDTSLDPPRFLVFFRAKDADVMTAAFKEYTGWQMKKEERRQSVEKRLEKAAEKMINHRERIRSRNRQRGQER